MQGAGSRHGKNRRPMASWASFFVVLAALALAGCDGAPRDNAPVPLRLGMDAWPGYFPAVLAERQGLMAAEGITLDVVPMPDTQSLIAGFAAGRFDLAAVSLGDAIILQRNRPDLIVLLVSNESTGGDQLMGRGGAALDGDGPLRIGTHLGGFGELFVSEWLERTGVDPARIVWTNVNASDVPMALHEGRIDLGHTWQPHADAAAQGAVAVFTSAETPGLIVDVVLTTRSVATRHPEAVRGFARAWFTALERWQAEPAAGHALAEAALGLEAGSSALDGIQLYGLDDNRRLMRGGSDAPLVSVVDRYADFFIERGRLAVRPDSTTMLDATLLPTEGASP